MPRDRAPRQGKPGGSSSSRPAPKRDGAPARGGKPASRGPNRPDARPSDGRWGAAGGESRPPRRDGQGSEGRFGAPRRDDAYSPRPPRSDDDRPRGARPPRDDDRPRGPRPARDDDRPRGPRPARDDDRPRGARPPRDDDRPRSGRPAGRSDERGSRGPRTSEGPSRPSGRFGAVSAGKPAARGPREAAPRRTPAREYGEEAAPELTRDLHTNLYEEDDAPRPRAPRVDRSSITPRRDYSQAPGTEDDAARNDIVFGRHPAIAALEGPAAVNKVWLLNGLRNQDLVNKVRQLAKEKGAAVQMVERPKLDALTFEGNHQGIVVSMAMASYVEIEEVIAAAKKQQYPSLLVLDGIEDPHNLGALVRTAEGANFAGVIISSRRQVGLTPTVAKAAAGALSRVPVARVGNLVQAVEKLKAAGFWLVGADAEGESLPYEVDMVRPLAYVIGGEGKGLSRLLGQKCDWRVRLTLGGSLESLNASVAGGVLMYEAVRQRWEAHKHEQEGQGMQAEQPASVEAPAVEGAPEPGSAE